MDIKEFEARLENKINRVHTQAEGIRRLLTDLSEKFPDHQITDLSDLEGLKVLLPWDIQALRQARQALGRGWKFKRTWGNKSPGFTYKIYLYRNPAYPYLDVWLDMTLAPQVNRPDEGAEDAPHCWLEQIGTEVIEQPIYKVVCNGKETQPA